MYTDSVDIKKILCVNIHFSVIIINHLYSLLQPFAALKSKARCNRYGAHKPIGFPAPFASIHVYYISSKACISVRSLKFDDVCIYAQTCLCANMHHTCMQGCMHAGVPGGLNAC